MDNPTLNSLLNNANEHIKNLGKFKKVSVVLGNETCDLDSAISSLVYSLLLYYQITPGSIVIPVFNIPRIQLSVKTEVTYFLKRLDINLAKIICRDEIDLKSLQTNNSLQLILVDHHVLGPSDKGLADSVVTVIDHRPQDPKWPWTHVDLTLQTVGSCSTLVADKLLKQAPQLVTPTIAMLLLGTILLDTACLSPAANRATPLDIQVADLLEPLCTQPLDSNQLFKDLRAAKSDVSSLTAAQLLIKDLKVAAGIPIAGLPMKVKEFLKRTDAYTAVQQLCIEHNTPVCVLYGAAMENETLTRDLAVFSHVNTDAASQVVAALKSFKDPDLDLQSQTCSVPDFTLFEQLNIKVTRKHFLPLIRELGETIVTKNL